MVSETRALLYKEVNHSFLNANIDEVEIDDIELAIVQTVLQQMTIPQEKVHHYAVTLMLIQVALDTHEKVVDKSDEARLNRQLTVLAGDYYSGLYYYLLAKEKDISLIRSLAEGISEINEHKIRVHTNHELTYDEWLSSIELIESMLLQKLCIHFDFVTNGTEISKLFLLNRLQKEYVHMKENGTSSLHGQLSELVEASSIIHMLSETIQRERELVEKSLQDEDYMPILAAIFPAK
nr:heptaprenyl diphosphate synthase component 1 [Priestia taiwanensis]